MAPNKFENKIKKTLETRTIEPSSDAWQELANRLETSQTKKNHKVYWWLGMAASFIGLLFIASQFFNDEKIIEPKISKIPTVIQQNGNVEVVNENSSNSNTILNQEKPVLSNEKTPINVNKKAIKNESIKLAFEKHLDTNETYKVEKLIDVSKEKLTFEEQKIQDVLAKIDDLKTKNNTVTDADIDALLLETQKEIRFQKMQTQVAGVIDAAQLLQEVEADIDQSFRSKVLEAIKATYGSVKTAVAQRNN